MVARLNVADLRPTIETIARTASVLIRTFDRVSGSFPRALPGPTRRLLAMASRLGFLANPNSGAPTPYLRTVRPFSEQTTMAMLETLAVKDDWKTRHVHRKLYYKVEKQARRPGGKLGRCVANGPHVAGQPALPGLHDPDCVERVAEHRIRAGFPVAQKLCGRSSRAIALAQRARLTSDDLWADPGRRIGSGKNHADNAPFLKRGLAGWVAVVLLAGCQTNSPWQEVKTTAGPMWQAESGAWLAKVDPARGRLTSLGFRNGPNLLHRPENPTTKLEFGGHRVWLGPQSEWAVDWPPPENWEMQPARRVVSRPGGRLVVESFPGPNGEPSIRREYRWIREGVLESRVSWREDSTKGRQAVQILQVESSAVVEAAPKPEPGVPRGFVRLALSSRPDTQRIFASPRHVRVERNRVLVTRSRTEEKLGFPVQTLVARWREAEMHLHPGPSSGRSVGEPDGVFRSQIYLGADDWPVLEIEQLSPRLRPFIPGGRVDHTMEIELRPRLKAEPLPPQDP